MFQQFKVMKVEQAEGKGRRVDYEGGKGRATTTELLEDALMSIAHSYMDRSMMWPLF